MIRPGILREALRLACTRDSPALSTATWNELNGVLNRPRLARYIDPVLREDTLALLRSTAVWFEPERRVRDCRDAKDNKCLELAIAAAAHTIVSSDEDLLVLHPWRGISIVKPRDYVTAAIPN
jgi:putative PIN family toxin of toxin-antitoxin system